MGKKKTNKHILRNSLIVIVGILVALFLFRGCAYRSAISYKESGGRKTYKVKDKNLAAFIEDEAASNNKSDIESIINLSLEITDKALEFSEEVTEKDPAKLVLLKRGNYASYASFTACVGNYLISKNKLSKVWEAKPVKGKLYVFGNDPSKKIKTSFFKDHDFVIFKNKETRREIAVDPAIFDCVGIDRVSIYK